MHWEFSSGQAFRALSLRLVPLGPGGGGPHPSQAASQPHRWTAKLKVTPATAAVPPGVSPGGAKTHAGTSSSAWSSCASEGDAWPELHGAWSRSRGRAARRGFGFSFEGHKVAPRVTMVCPPPLSWVVLLCVHETIWQSAENSLVFAVHFPRVRCFLKLLLVVLWKLFWSLRQ